jgi:hypothetical protein
MFDPLVIDKAVDPDRPQELPYRSEYQYLSFVDVAGGGGKDAFSICLGHKEGGRVIVDVVRSRRPQFNPDEVTAQYSELLKSYHIREVRGDKFSGDWASSAFEKYGIHYERSEKTKSELYIESESIFNTERAELPNRSSLIDQLKMLIRKARSGGHDSVDSDSGQPEDEANTVCGLIWLLSSSEPFFDLTKLQSSLRPQPQKPALSGVEAAKSSFRDFIAGRKKSAGQIEEEALLAEIEKEDREIERELGLENRSVGYTMRWKK